MPQRIIHGLAKGGEVSLIWPSYVSFGGITFGLFSIPSSGSARILIPLFLAAGVLIGSGVLFELSSHDKARVSQLTLIGLSIMILAGCARAISLWGIDQQGAGSNVLASIVWCWITLGCVFLFVAVWLRGVS